MVAIKAADVARFVARPDPGKPIELIFGPDAGLVRERTDALLRGAVDDPRDPFATSTVAGMSSRSSYTVSTRPRCAAMRRPPQRHTTQQAKAADGLVVWKSYTTSLIGKEVRHGTGTSIGFG
jgi:hypothetical protein